MRTLVCLVLFGVVWFWGLGHRPLFNTDEGRYAEIPREMVMNGDWVTPYLNGFRYFEKPPLQYWATASAYVVFGVHDWSARLWSALTSFLTVLLTALAAWRLYGTRAGWMAGTVLAGSFYFGFMGHFNSLDAGLAFFMAVTAFGLVLGLRAPPRSREALGWMLAAYAGAALAVLSKGLIGILLPGAVLVLYILLKRDWKLLARLYIVPGVALFFALTLPWFIAVSIENHDFLWQFFMVQQFLRFLTPISDRTAPGWYFLPILLLGVLPWLASAVIVLVRGARGLVRREAFNPAVLLWIWVVFIFVFFSISHSKLPSYILPVMPALAVLIGGLLVKLRRPPWWACGLSIALGCAGIAAALTAGGWVQELDPARVAAFVPWLLAASGLVLVTGVAGLFAGRRAAAGIVALAASWLVATRLLMLGWAIFGANYSTRALVQSVARYNRPDVPVYSLGGYQQSLPFYLGRTMTLVKYEGELKFGIDHARGSLEGRYIPTIREFARVWKQSDEGIAFIPESSLSDLHGLRLRYRIVGEAAGWVAFAHVGRS